MLSVIRKASKNVTLRVVFGLLITFMLLINLPNLKHLSHDNNLVSFSKAQNITKEEYNNLNAHMNSKDNSHNMLYQLINIRILDYIVKKYNLDITESRVVQIVHTMPIFHDKAGNFSIDNFHKTFNYVTNNEHRYLSEIKHEILRNLTQVIFTNCTFVPKAIINSNINYILQTRNVDIIEINLDTDNNKYSKPPTTAELQEFYSKNQQLFTLDEARSFQYIKIPLSYFNKNSNQDAIQSQLDLIQNLEEDVASGINITDIAQKYNLQLKNDSGSYAELKYSNPNIADIVFELNNQELSYPKLLEQDKAILLIELNNIITPKTEDFNTAINKIKYLFNKKRIEDCNWSTIQNCQTKYKPNNEKQLKSGLHVRNITLRKDSNMFPKEFISCIFNTTPGNNSNVFKLGNIAYFAHIKSINIDTTHHDDDMINAITNNVKSGILQELIQYCILQNEMHIHQ